MYLYKIVKNLGEQLIFVPDSINMRWTCDKTVQHFLLESKSCARIWEKPIKCLHHSPCRLTFSGGPILLVTVSFQKLDATNTACQAIDQGFKWIKARKNLDGQQKWFLRPSRSSTQRVCHHTLDMIGQHKRSSCRITLYFGSFFLQYNDSSNGIRVLHKFYGLKSILHLFYRQNSIHDPNNFKIKKPDSVFKIINARHHTWN